MISEWSDQNWHEIMAPTCQCSVEDFNFKELKAMFSKAGLSSPSKRKFNKLDTNKNGKLEGKEMKNWPSIHYFVRYLLNLL